MPLDAKNTSWRLADKTTYETLETIKAERNGECPSRAGAVPTMEKSE